MTLPTLFCKASLFVCVCVSLEWSMTFPICIRLKTALCSGDSPVMTEEEFSFEHFSWAVGNVFARSLLLSIQDTGSMVPVLLPGFDEFELTIQNASKITLENDTVVLKSLTGAKA